MSEEINTINKQVDGNGHVAVDEPPVESTLAIGIEQEGVEKNVAQEPIVDDNKSGDLVTDQALDVFGYTRRDGVVSCELFKIEVKNLPPHADYTSVKKMIANKFKVKPQKIKIVGTRGSKMSFVAFSCESDRDIALKGLNGHVWKGRELQASVAAPVADPLLLKRAQEDENQCQDRDGPDEKRSKTDGTFQNVQEVKSVEQLLKEQVAPLTGISYTDQLEMKKKEFIELSTDLLKEIGRIINQSKKSNERRDGSRTDELLKWYVERRKADHLFCPIETVAECPPAARTHYRNKCEFSFGPDKSIGFRLGCYKDGSLKVASIASHDCSLVPAVMKVVVTDFEQYIRSKTKYLLPFDQVTHTGHMTQLTLRKNLKGKVMVILFLNPQDLSDEQLEEELTEMKNYFSNPDIVSFYLQVVRSKGHELGGQESKPRLIAREPVITERLVVKFSDSTTSELNFNISPNAFFQVNSMAAEVCYGAIGDLLGLSSKTILLDICCGTGTIGLSLASKTRHVFGIELSKDAISDSRKNAALNGITNVTFYDGKAESVVPLVIQKIRGEFPDSQIVAVIDPPRAGLNSSVMKSLRSTAQITRLLYVSCEPKFSRNNLIDLVRPVSKAFRGDPFISVKSVLVDMFPDTKRSEALFLYERLNLKEKTTD